MLTAFPDQIECIESAIRDFETFQKLLLVCPTGSGKSFMAWSIANHFLEKNQRVLFLANRNELTGQAIKECHQAIGIYPQLEKADARASLTAPVVVGSIQSLKGERLGRWPVNHFGLVIFDEAHFSLAKTSQAILQSFSAKVLGITATPNRSDKRNLGEYYEKITKELLFFDLVHKGRLCPVTIENFPIKIDLKNVGQGKTEFGKDFNPDDLDCALEPYFEQIANELKHRAMFRRTLVFLPLIKTSKRFTEVCIAAGINARHVDGTSDDRDDVLTDFKAGKFDVLCNAQLLSYGYNDPGIDGILNLRLTQSISMYWQMIGRGTRTFPGKRDLRLYDCLYQHEKHGVIRPAHLIAKSQEEAEEMIELSEKDGQRTFNLEDLQGEAAGSREEKLMRELEAKSKRKGRVIDAAEFCMSSRNFSEAEYDVVMPDQMRPATDGQVAVLEKYAIDVTSIKGGEHADKVINLIGERMKAGLASPNQLRCLIQMKYPSPHTATFEQATNFLNRRFGQARKAA